MNRQTLDILYKLTVRSVVDYALPVYCNNLRQTELARLEKLQYRAAKIVTGALHFSSRDKLNSELGWESIQCRANMLGLNIFHKIHLNETRPLIKICMPKLDWERRKPQRSKGGYLPFDNKNDKFNKSFFPHTTKLWNSLGANVHNKNLEDFKIHTKTMKPTKYKPFHRGNKYSNTLLTRIRVGRSDLNQQKFSIGLTDNPQCLCHHREESPQHYFIDCFLYSLERQTLFNLIEHYIPKFHKLSKKEKLRIIIFGIDIDNDDFVHLNTTLTNAVQNFILKTKRFEIQ